MNDYRVKKLGIIGFPLSHSFSPGYFKNKFNEIGLAGRWTYRAYPITKIADLPELMESEYLVGLNVTIPHKVEAIKYVRRLDDWATAAGSVNTLRREKDGSWSGFNTDAPGFIKTIEENKIKCSSSLVLGTGGAARGVVAALKWMGSKVTRVSRTSGLGDISYRQLDIADFSSYDLIVNATPLGMFPEVNLLPDIPYHRLKMHQTLYDMVYNPAETVFLSRGSAMGCKVINGLDMLRAQADLSWSIWMEVYGDSL